MKAEFAADLNNLSNRMAQLENSLDAKIDSLVSSYLTRNGIWNGAKQEIVYSGIAQGLGWTTSSGVHMIHQAYNADLTTFIDSANDPYIVTSLGSSRTNILCINTINKSGLLRLFYNLFRISYNDESISSGLSIQPSKRTSNNRFSERNFTIAQIYYYIHQDMWVDEQTSSLGVIYAECTQFASVIPHLRNYGISIYTFVEKGKPLYVTEKLLTQIPDTQRACWKQVGGGSVKGRVVFSLQPISASVY